jgi:hypothetical protein
MNWTRFALAVLAAGFVTSMTDWLFMGDLLYKHFDKNPEIWRISGGKSESKAIAWSIPIPLLTIAAFDFLCVHFRLHSYRAAFEFALAVWLVAPLPMLVTNAIWIKISAPITASYSIGWLVKLLVAAFFVILLVG